MPWATDPIDHWATFINELATRYYARKGCCPSELQVDAWVYDQIELDMVESFHRLEAAGYPAGKVDAGEDQHGIAFNTAVGPVKLKRSAGRSAQVQAVDARGNSKLGALERRPK